MDLTQVFARNKRFAKKYTEKYIKPFLSELKTEIDLKEDKSESLNFLNIWLQFWTLKGKEITNSTWKLLYEDYLLENPARSASIDSEEIVNNTEEGKIINEHLKKSYSVENLLITLGHLSFEKSITASEQVKENCDQENVDGWQILWNKHHEQQYSINFAIFNKIYTDLIEKENPLLNEEAFSLVRVVLDCEEEKPQLEINPEFDSNTTEDEVDIMMKMGLPVAFGKGKNKRKKDKSKIEKFLSDLPVEDNDQNNMPETIEERISILGRNETAPPEIRADKTLLKYWKKRFSLFSRFDQGVQLDRESWFSVTPEKVAKHIAERLSCDIIVDAFCGCGGNTIQFAYTCKKVIAIDIDPEKIKLAKHNAELYGVKNRIEFILADFFHIYKNLKADIVFLSPPWGGPTYNQKDSYDVEKDLLPISASELLNRTREVSQNIALYLPRNSDVEKIAITAGKGNKVEIERNYLGRREVALTAFYGDLVKT